MTRSPAQPFLIGILVSVAAICVALAQAPPPPDSRSIRGEVSDPDGVPLRRARIVVSSYSNDTVFTDDDGRFVIERVLSTTLTVRVTKAGYTEDVATVDANERASVRFTLARSAALGGRVRDTFGAPVTDAYVIARLIQPVGTPTKAASSVRPFVKTDAWGDFRLGGLPPGEYEVSAARVASNTPRQRQNLENVLFGPRPALTASSETQRIRLAPGDERPIDFTLDGPSEPCAVTPDSWPPGAGTAVIRGRVVGASGEPLPCATVRIQRPASIVRQVQTNAQGAYAIDGLPAGSFAVAASKLGYVRLAYGQRVPQDPELPVSLRTGEQRRSIDFVLPVDPVVTGTVRDERGEPVTGIRVMPIQLVRMEGRTTAIAPGAFPIFSDDSGRFRLPVPVPGKYLIAATSSADISMTQQGRAHVYATTYYPGTSDLSTAQPVDVEVGRNVSAIDIQLIPSFAATVSGIVLDAGGRPFSGRISLSGSVRSNAVMSASRTAQADATGAFIIRNVPPGDYVVSAAPERQFGMRHVTVVDTDPPPVLIRASAGASVAGGVLIDGIPAPDDAGITVTAYPVDLDLAPPSNGPRGSLGSSVLEGARFRLAGITGRARLSVATPKCESCYVKTAFVNGADAVDSGFDPGVEGSSVSDAGILVSAAGASLEARVRGEPATSTSSVILVVFSTDRELWYPRSQHVKTPPAASRPARRVTGLPPGPYFVAAYDARAVHVDGGSWNDPSLLERLASRAQRITLAERELRIVDLPLIAD
ncbi:MAG TPA: carboxypeptidase-like regulatory domain-containing protein [Vicinamibacterales bacterium]|nr:carboxypeptidase-like regulatory domain-containing protein [Vicinamibacterales bacterium]